MSVTVETAVDICGRQIAVEYIKNIANLMGVDFYEAIVRIANALNDYDRRVAEANLEAERKRIEAMMEEMDYCHEEIPSRHKIMRHTDPRNKRNCKPIKGYKQQSAWLRTCSNPKLR